jgi:hypothetical protein
MTAATAVSLAATAVVRSSAARITVSIVPIVAIDRRIVAGGSVFVRWALFFTLSN